MIFLNPLNDQLVIKLEKIQFGLIIFHLVYIMKSNFYLTFFNFK